MSRAFASSQELVPDPSGGSANTKASAIVIWMLSTWSRFSSGSMIELANRATMTSVSGSMPSQWSTR